MNIEKLRFFDSLRPRQLTKQKTTQKITLISRSKIEKNIQNTKPRAIISCNYAADDRYNITTPLVLKRSLTIWWRLRGTAENVGKISQNVS